MSSHPEGADDAEARKRDIDTLLAEIADDPYVRQQLAESLADFQRGDTGRAVLEDSGGGPGASWRDGSLKPP